MKIEQFKEIVNDIQKLNKYGRSLYKLNEAYCNRDLTPREEKKRAKIEKEIKAIANKYGFNVIFYGDPRGASFRLFDKETPTTHIQNAVAF